jgi:hypothetical protein
MKQLAKGAYGAVKDPTCSGGLCAYVADHDRDCVLQGCTRPCSTDEDCPQSAVCQDNATCPTPSSFKGYCKPGGRNFIGVGLTCL